MEELTNLITSVGFPIAITVYLLIRFDGIMKNVVLSQQKLIESVDRLCERLKER